MSVLRGDGDMVCNRCKVWWMWSVVLCCVVDVECGGCDGQTVQKMRHRETFLKPSFLGAPRRT